VAGVGGREDVVRREVDGRQDHSGEFGARHDRYAEVPVDLLRAEFELVLPVQSVPVRTRRREAGADGPGREVGDPHDVERALVDRQRQRAGGHLVVVGAPVEVHAVVAHPPRVGQQPGERDRGGGLARAGVADHEVGAARVDERGGVQDE
jgi:hypothetical protein